jgi:hypothetical protein
MTLVCFSHLLILYLFSLIFVSYGVEIVETPIRSIKTVSLFGDIYTLGTFEFEFDQELEVTKAFTVCEKCPITQKPSCDPCYFPAVCDYSREGGACPCVSGGFAIIPCLIDNYLNSSDTGFDLSHTEIEGTVTFYTISLPLIQDCHPVVFRTGSLDSWGSTIILSTRFVNESTYATPIIGDMLVGFCPEDQEQYLGSLVVQFDLRQPHASTVNTNFRSTILPSTANYPGGSNCILPSNLVATHECISPGIRKIIPRNYGIQYLKYYAVPVPSGQCVYLSHGGDNLATWMSFTDPFVNASSNTKDKMIWNARPVWVEIIPYHRQSVTFLRYVCIPNNTNYLYAQILFENQVNNTQLTQDPQFWFSISTNNLYKIPFSDMQPSTFSHNFIGDITVRCGNKTFNNLEGFPTWFPQDSGILNVRAMWPTEEPHYFYPVPIFLGSDQRVITTIPKLGPLTPKKFTVGVLLDWDRHNVPLIHPADTILPIKTRFLTAEEFNTCTVEFHGSISGINDGPNDKPLVGIYSDFVDKDLSCDYDVFIELSEQIDELLKIVTDTVTVADVLNLTLVINQIENLDMYRACSKFLSDKITTYETPRNYTTDSCAFEPGTKEFDNDDCCNPDKSGYGNCEVKNVVASVSVYGDANTDGTSSPVCAAHLLQKLQDEINRVTQPEGCRDPIDEIAAFRGRQIFKYVECRRLYSTARIDQYAGAGHKPCIHDSDCYPGNCTTKGFCIQNINEVIDEIIGCVIDNLDPFVISKLKEKAGKQPEENVTPAQFREVFSISSCVDDSYLRFPPHKQVYAGCSQPSGCPEGTQNLLAQGGFETNLFKYHDIYDMYPFGQDCLQQCTSSRAQYNPPSFGQSCDKIYCNWFQCDPAVLTDENCQLTCNSTYPAGSSFCGLCEDGLQCIDYTNILPNQTICENSKLCILEKNRTTGNLHIITVSSFEECNSTGFCDVCELDDCSTQNKCEVPENGYCTDSTDEEYGLWVRPPFKDSKGACSVRIKYNLPFDQTRDYDCLAPSVKTVLGDCLDPNTTQSECTIMGYKNLPPFSRVISAKWIRPAATQSECETFYSNEICFRAPNYEFSVAVGYANIVNRPNIGEQQCTGSFRIPFTWIQGKWRNGQTRDLSWRLREHSNRVHIGQIAFDFNNFSDVLSESVTEFYGLKLQDELYCSHALTNSYLQQLSCFFLDGNQTEENCISKEIAPIVAISSVCTDSISESFVPPFTLIFNKSFFGTYRCERTIFRQIPRLDFKNTKPASISILLIDYGEDDNFTRRNSLNAVYGKILTNGLNITCNEQLYNVTFQIKKDDTTLGASDQFPDLMVAELAKNNSLQNFIQPLPIYKVIDNGDEFIFTLDYVNNGSTYFVMSVVHVDNPENTNYNTDIDRVFFEPGEIAYLIIIIILYAMGCFVTFIKILLFFTTVKADLTSVRMFLVLFTIFTFFLFRTILFSLILSGTIVDTKSPAVGYVLIEFPVILFFSFVTQYIVLWFFLVKISRTQIIVNWIKYANIIVLLTNIFILTMFIIMIILFETIVQKPTVVCNKEVSVYDSGTAFIILMVYRAIFSFISFALAFLLFLSGTRLLTKYRKEMPIRKMTKIGAATIAGTFGLIAQGIFYLVLTATSSHISNYITLSILLVVEIIPAYCFLILAEVSIKVIMGAIETRFTGSGSAGSESNQ